MIANIQKLIFTMVVRIFAFWENAAVDYALSFFPEDFLSLLN